MTSDKQAATHVVVVNIEEQYSIWPSGRQLPQGWRRVGVSGTEAECLERIAALWTDMRPLSMRGEPEAVTGERPARPRAHP